MLPLRRPLSFVRVFVQARVCAHTPVCVLGESLFSTLPHVITIRYFNKTFSSNEIRRNF